MSLPKLLRGIGFSVLDLLYPPTCFICGRPLEEHRYLCSECLHDFHPLSPPLCEHCGAPLEVGNLCERCLQAGRQFQAARSVGYYERGSSLTEAIHGLKYEGERALASELAGLFTGGITGKLLQSSEAITYVPQSRRKNDQRGFNHAALLAESLGDTIGKPVVSALSKVEETPDQVGLDHIQRRANLQDVFRAEHADGLDTCALVDDVLTTGTTAEQCGKALRGSGWETVYVVTLARGGING